MQITDIHIYPVKGLKGVRHESAFVERRGLRYDRRWMIIDDEGVFRSQRSQPKMALIGIEMESDGFCLRSSSSSIYIPFEPEGAEIQARVWKDDVRVRLVRQEVDTWLSDALEIPCRLVALPVDSIRPTHPDYSQPGDHVSFADGFPLLLANEGSLRDLNERLAQPVPMDRFRPSVVVGGFAPWAEDGWEKLAIGTIPFRNVKPCGRCLVTTIDQEQGTLTGDEPLRTLAEFRKVGASVNFGVNLIPDAEGWIHVGDKLLVA